MRLMEILRDRESETFADWARNHCDELLDYGSYIKQSAKGMLLNDSKAFVDSESL
jgi:hypothetical protein